MTVSVEVLVPFTQGKRRPDKTHMTTLRELLAIGYSCLLGGGRGGQNQSSVHILKMHAKVQQSELKLNQVRIFRSYSLFCTKFPLCVAIPPLQLSPEEKHKGNFELKRLWETLT